LIISDLKFRKVEGVEGVEEICLGRLGKFRKVEEG